jgi:hypothetical protein
VRTLDDGKRLARRIAHLDWSFSDWRDLPEETRLFMRDLTRDMIREEKRKMNKREKHDEVNHKTSQGAYHY